MSDYTLALRRAETLQEGDHINVEGLKYFELPDTYPDDFWSYELALVAGVKDEGNGCINIMIEGVDHFGVPKGYLIPKQVTWEENLFAEI